MAYENLCMYCFKDLGGDSICPHCGKDARAAVPQIQMLPGTPVYRDRFLLGRALGQDASGIVYTALDTKRGGTIRIREYLPRNCAERLNDGTVVPIAGMEDAFDAGMRKLRASVDSVEDPKKRHFYFEENGTAYIAQRKNGGGSSAPMRDYADDEDDADHKKAIALYIAIAAAVVLAVAIGLIWFLNSMSDPDDVTLPNTLSTTSPGATWMPAQTPTPTPYATATFAALVDPELSWMDYTYKGDVNDDYQQQLNASATKKPTVDTNKDYNTINTNSNASKVKELQEYLVKLGWLDYTKLSGKYDAATKQAVKDFQNYVNNYCSPATKLAVDGIAGEKTQQWLYNASVSLVKPTPTPTPLVTAAPDDTVVNENSPAVDIRALQNKLIALGVMQPGTADGKYGSATATGVKNFQIRVNQLQGYTALEITGKVDELTMAYLNYYIQWWENQQQATATPTVPAATATLEPLVTQAPTAEPTRDPSAPIDASSTREEISYVQEMLEIVGLLKSGSVDGVYGSGTTAAVKTFQNWVNEVRGEQTLQVNGVCDQLTRSYLEYCVQNGMTVTQPTTEPTVEPTAVPTEAPALPTEEPPVYDPGEGEGESSGGETTIDPSSPSESISFVQEMLAEIGLLDSSQVDGQYGEVTKQAIRALQEYVNQQGGQQLEVTGICDNLTLEALMYCYDYGITIGGQQQPEPTQAPEQPQSSGITPDSPRETISYMQEMLSNVGLLDENQVDGDYGANTMEAIRTLQQFVNDTYGQELLPVNGICDENTLLALQKCYEEGWNVVDRGDEPEATQEPIPEATEEPTPEPTAEPTEGPSLGVIDSFSVYVSGMESSGGLIELNPGKHDVTWQADGDVAAYFLYLFDGNKNLIKSAENSNATGFTMDTSAMNQGEIYELRVGAMPMNGTQEHILWQSVQMMLPVQATPEPTAEPTPEPTAAPSVSAPAINIGSSVYQKDGVTYVNDSTIIFSWMASGEVQSYTVNLVYEDGTTFSLGTTSDTSKTVSAGQLAPGLYKLYVGATPVGGNEESTIWSELLFGVPAPEPTAAPEPEVPEAPAEPEVEESVISYIDANSAAGDIQTVQMALYKHGLLDADSIQPGVLDAGTLAAVAAFQQKVNDSMGAGLYVIDPASDAFIDNGTLQYLLYGTGL